MISPQDLLAELDAQRRHVKDALAGLSDAQLRTTVPPTSWAPLAVVHHLALDVERWWFQAVVADDRDAWDYFDANPDGAWALPSGVDVLALYDAECAVTNSIVMSTDLDAEPGSWPLFMGPVWPLGRVLLHVIGETAAHAGQLDIVRETIDGHRHLIMD